MLNLIDILIHLCIIRLSMFPPHWHYGFHCCWYVCLCFHCFWKISVIKKEFWTYFFQLRKGIFIVVICIVLYSNIKLNITSSNTNISKNSTRIDLFECENILKTFWFVNTLHGCNKGGMVATIYLLFKFRKVIGACPLISSPLF